MKKNRIAILMLASSVMLCPVATIADDAYIMYRQQIMQAVGGHAGAIGSIVKSKLPELDAVALHADAIATTADTVQAAFANELYEGATDSKVEIWQNMEDFLALNEKMREESLALAEIARSGEHDAVRTSIRSFTKSCGACHRLYRKPKEESYKQLR